MEKDKEKDIIDFGSVDVPKSWKEINLKTFQDIERYYADKDKQFNIIEVLHIVLNKDKDWVMSLPSEFLDIILEKLAFLQTQPEVKEPTNKIKKVAPDRSELFSINLLSNQFSSLSW